MAHKKRSANRPPRPRLGTEERRQQLLGVAAEILTQRGVAKLEFTELALAAGVTRPVVYKFFPNRQALLVAVLEDFERALTARFFARAAAMLPGDLEDATRLFIDAICDTIEEKGAGAWHLLDAKGADPEAARVGGEILDRLVRPWRPRIQEATGASGREVTTLSHMLIAAGRAVLELWYRGSISRKEAARDATRGVSALLLAFTKR